MKKCNKGVEYETLFCNISTKKKETEYIENAFCLYTNS